MGTGKSSVARELARVLGRKIIDIDSEIEKKGMPITEIFRQFGEARFRDMETATVKEASALRSVIISTGGGVVLRRENMVLLMERGVVVCLTATPETILQRTSKTNERPLLQVPDPLGKIRDLLHSRESCYRQADIIINTEEKNPRQIAEEIIEKVSEVNINRGPAPSVRVGLGERSYDIYIGRGIMAGLGQAISGLGRSRQVALISNPTIYPLYGPAVLASLKDAGFDTVPIIIPDGEEFKNLDSANIIYGELLKQKFDRHSILVALGGGVIGDITGFAASTYMRGINFVQVPTTLLAQVDSSVGGKTGVNHPLGKNMIGTFWQPRMVWIDTDTLNTLPGRELLAGMAEVIKYGIIRDEPLFRYLENEKGRILALSADAIGHIVKRSCEIKAGVVSLDERESGLRAILNYGHTIGHAIETLTGYKEYLHGEAVAIGMHFEAGIARGKGILKRADEERIKELIALYELPVDMPRKLGLQEIYEAMQVDKKVSEGAVRVVLPERIGSVLVEKIEKKDIEGLF